MSWKRTVVLFVFLIALALFYFFEIQKGHFNFQVFSLSPEPPALRILNISREETVHELEIRHGEEGDRFVLRRDEGGKWNLEEPIRYPAEPLIVDGLMTLLRLTPRARELPFEESQAEELGFQKPKLTICLAAGGELDKKCLWIGTDAAIIKGAYAKWQDEDRYFLVDEDFLKAFDKSLYSLRKKQIFNLIGRDISSIQFRSSHFEALIENKGSQWFSKKPAEATLGASAVGELLTALSGLYVKEFLDTEPKSDKKYGFHKPKRIIRVTFQDGTEATLIQGAEVGGRAAYYVKMQNEETLFLVSIEKLNQIEDHFRKVGL